MWIVLTILYSKMVKTMPTYQEEFDRVYFLWKSKIFKYGVLALVFIALEVFLYKIYEVGNRVYHTAT